MAGHPPQGLGIPQSVLDAAIATHAALDTAVHGAGGDVLATDADIASHAADFGLHSLIVRKTANQIVNNSTAMVNDTHLLIPVGANEVWSLLYSLYGSSHASADFKFDLAGPSGSTLYPTNALIFAGQGTGNVIGITLTQLIENGATPGNAVLQWAQQAAISADTILYEHSLMRAIQLA